MPVTLGWHEIAIRLVLSVVAGALLGLDRGEHGRPAGLRTTLLVCLAAAVAMLQVNLLMNTKGKPSDSFVVLDLMRLPLGILTGVGFIGAGAILRRDGLVLGVTTAATLWFATVVGLCLGGGQLALGMVALGLGMLILSGLRWFESGMKQDQYGTLIVTTTVTADAESLPEQEICDRALESGYHIASSSASYSKTVPQRTLEFQLHWRARSHTGSTPEFVGRLSEDPHVATVEWKTLTKQ
jgi:putative Mg2+ transporter-C (MgtC) family protein